ncbi:hypothetical protein VTI74DRAFT_8913 [Chaetomium olivicolor]
MMDGRSQALFLLIMVPGLSPCANPASLRRLQAIISLLIRHRGLLKSTNNRGNPDHNIKLILQATSLIRRCARLQICGGIACWSIHKVASSSAHVQRHRTPTGRNVASTISTPPSAVSPLTSLIVSASHDRDPCRSPTLKLKRTYAGLCDTTQRSGEQLQQQTIRLDLPN